MSAAYINVECFMFHEQFKDQIIIIFFFGIKVLENSATTTIDKLIRGKKKFIQEQKY